MAIHHASYVAAKYKKPWKSAFFVQRSLGSPRFFEVQHSAIWRRTISDTRPFCHFVLKRAFVAFNESRLRPWTAAAAAAAEFIIADIINLSEAEEETDSWSQLELPMKTWLIVLACVVFFWIFLSAFLAFCCGPKFVECHLCEEPIPKRHWNKQDHWDNCNRDHERFLNELPDTDYRCPS